MVYRVYVEKKEAFAVEAAALQTELVQTVGIRGLNRTRVVQRYDIEGISGELFRQCVQTVFSEPPVDTAYYKLPACDFICPVESLPGQFDQRASSASECIQLISHGERPRVQSAKLYLFEGRITDADKKKIEKHLINPVDSRIAGLSEKETLKAVYPEPPDIAIIDGFTELKDNALSKFIGEYALAMDADDLAFCVNYFKAEERNPSVTELRVIDTYWSDHCRHTTFNTVLDKAEIEDDDVQKTYSRYLEIRDSIYKEKHKPVTLMDIATIGAKYLLSQGKLRDWDKGPENNACSIKIKVDNDGKDEDWLLLFKNETHNHPTEIEPFGGAATCIGGAIRDPLSGRAYVYQAMRVTGAGNPLAPIAETLAGKLPQRSLVTAAANGYSSYGNQIGLATGLVEEFYHEGYTAKRMEIGAVLGAIAADKVRREEPLPGDLVILAGGRTGRDGCGGATGSSKEHKKESLETCGAEVQKGNPPVERALQRLFRNPDAVRMIKRCNDFGAGGVSVAIGELADGLEIDLDAVPRKYEGLDGTELAISESQERMAIVADKKDADRFIALAANENLEAAVVARVTDKRRLVMKWRGKTIVSILRDFLNSSGAEKHASVKVRQNKAGADAGKGPPPPPASLKERFTEMAADLNVCGKKGLFERFDSTIGSLSVLMPAGGVYQLTPAQCMAAKLPADGGTETCSGMAFGFDPFVAAENPYEGAYIAVLESIARLVAAGFPASGVYLSLQEYFPRPRDDEERWGLPFAALLGALQAQLDFGAAAIGGKDSMSGSFESLDVPPSLVAFAVAVGKAGNIIGGELKAAGHQVVRISPDYRSRHRPEAASFTSALKLVERLILGKSAVSVYTPGRFGAAEALFKMSVGNRLGVSFEGRIDADRLFSSAFGSFIVELNGGLSAHDITGEGVSIEPLGVTTDAYTFVINGETVDLSEVQEAWEAKLEGLFPYRASGGTPDAPSAPPPIARSVPPVFQIKRGGGRPRALIPVFPGTNCEYDTERALRAAGAEAETFVIRNLTPRHVAESAALLAEKIGRAQMLVLPGGFSGGDEPDGSAKLIAAFLRGRAVADAVSELLETRDGLILGICNGFQALIKLGLVPFGAIRDSADGGPTLTFNRIGRHQSLLVRTRVCSALSPWLLCEEVGAVHTLPVSHGEGRFAADPALALRLSEAGQIAAQYVGLDGSPSMDPRFNPAGSMMAVEALSDPSGRVLGKMAHSERTGAHLYRNVPGSKRQRLFEGGVKYFRG